MSDDLNKRVTRLDATMTNIDQTLVRLEKNNAAFVSQLDLMNNQWDMRFTRLESMLDTRLARMENTLETRGGQIDQRIGRLFYCLLATSAAGFATLAEGFHWW